MTASDLQLQTEIADLIEHGYGSAMRKAERIVAMVRANDVEFHGTLLEALIDEAMAQLPRHIDRFLDDHAQHVLNGDGVGQPVGLLPSGACP